MLRDGKVNVFTLVVVLALALGIPLVGALVATKLVLQWLVF
jgi:hypothetical protein